MEVTARGGSLCIRRVQTPYRMSEQLPIRQKGISLGRDYGKSETAWRVVVWDETTKKIYGVEESESALFSFDPSAKPEDAVKRLGQMAIPELATRRDVPYASLSLALGHDRKLYFAAAAQEFDYNGGASAKASHLMTYDLRSGKTEDLGEMRLPDGRPVLGTNSADTGPDGTIYFVGAIGVKEGSPDGAGSAGKVGGEPYRLALFIYHPNRKAPMNKTCLFVVIGLLLAASAFARRNPSYDGSTVPQTRIDMRDLGYSPVDVIPYGESGITSLSTAPNGDIYGATSGTRSHLFVLNPQHGYVIPIGVIPGATSITHAVVISDEGKVFIGTAPAGHLLEYSPRDFDNGKIEIETTLPVTDHGTPIPGESIFALTIDRKANKIYGLTFPECTFFQLLHRHEKIRRPWDNCEGAPC